MMCLWTPVVPHFIIIDFKIMRAITAVVLLLLGSVGYSQERVNPVIKNYGAIYDIPEATVKVDPTMEYKVVIDVFTGSDEPDKIVWGLNNVARMINLHAVSGLKMEQMSIVLAIHGAATYAVMDNKLYKKRFGIDNPNLPLIQELKKAGVKLAVCGQSLIGRDVPVKEVTKEVEIATSMLTTVTTHQLKGYAILKF